MISWKYRTWRGIGVAAALGLAACGSETAGEAGEGVAATGEAGEAAIGEAGGEHGEAGVATAYAGLEGEARTALRLQHLRGFALIAERVLQDGGDTAAAGALLQQGLLEVYDPAADQFGAFDATPLRQAAAATDRALLETALRDSVAAFDSAGAGLDANAADIAARMVDLATGLYQHVDQDGAVDPIEYQHSLGAALAARQALSARASELQRADAQAYADARAEIERFIALWPESTAPAQPARYQQVLAQSSRVRLALSPYL